MRTHQEIDARSLAMHRLVAEKLSRDPALLDRARRTLQRWRAPSNPTRAEPYLAEWQRLLDLGLEATLATLLEDSERATALRSCSPFTGILTPAERFDFLRAWSRSHAA